MVSSRPKESADHRLGRPGGARAQHRQQLQQRQDDDHQQEPDERRP
jgi:hypothetical protein